MDTPASTVLDLPASPAGHYKLHVLATVIHLIEQASSTAESTEALFEHFPFLTAYLEEIPLPPHRGPNFWPEAIRLFEARTEEHLPLRALRYAAGLDHAAMTLLIATGLIEEDARFGPLFDAMQDTTNLRRPTLGLLNAWWREPVDGGEVRARIRQLRELGLVQVANPEAPRLDWALHAPSMLWDAIRGETPENPASWLRHRSLGSLPRLADLIVPDALAEPLARVPRLLASGDARALILRGPRRNGRHTVLGGVAQALGRGVLEASGLKGPEDERWRLLGPLATLLQAMPVLTFEAGAGETVEIPALAGYAGPTGIVLGKTGGLSGPGADGALALTLSMPDPEARKRHWQAGLAGYPCSGLDDLTERFRMTSGNLRRAATLARSYTALRDGDAVHVADVRSASRALNRQALDTLATRLDSEGTLKSLAAGAETLGDLDNLVARCRHRERLQGLVGEALRGQINPGVRALFQGPSGTGKTLAARLLASELGMDLYRVDLSSVVSKFIGETEKNLGHIFSLAEELDIILLLDEGDSLLTQRTAVQTSNDRYANLETNYLLQRIESFEGILLITTNAGEHIDGAFQRRMDVTVDFRAPEPNERLRLWHLHLPANHEVHPTLLRDLSARCALTGGQIRNVVLHASLLALASTGTITTADLETAAQREYRKTGATYPLRRRSPAAEG